MQVISILHQYPRFIEQELVDRFFKPETIKRLYQKLPPTFERYLVGKSFLGKDITLLKWGSGPVKIFLWSQMHGDEPTGTMALFDLFNFLQEPDFKDVWGIMDTQATLYFLPMVNPDGAEKFSRRNAQHIDINRDYLQAVTPEGRLLKELRDQFQPDFGFNLHDQSNLWSVKNTRSPATLSFLAPAFEEKLLVNEVREKAMLVIADIHQQLRELLPEQMGLFDDEYEPRAFGDNFQATGTATILIEAGGLIGDEEKQQLRKYYFLSMLSGLYSIASKRYEKQSMANYQAIPSNSKEIFHILITNLVYQNTLLSIGLCYEEEALFNGVGTKKCYVIQDIGDLRALGAYQVIGGEALQLEGELAIYKPANFVLKRGMEIIMVFRNGTLQSKL